MGVKHVENLALWGTDEFDFQDTIESYCYQNQE